MFCNLSCTTELEAFFERIAERSLTIVAFDLAPVQSKKRGHDTCCLCPKDECQTWLGKKLKSHNVLFVVVFVTLLQQ